MTFCFSPSLSHYESEIAKIQKSPKCCQKISNSAKAKGRNYEIEQNWIQPAMTLTQYHNKLFFLLSKGKNIGLAGRGIFSIIISLGK